MDTISRRYGRYERIHIYKNELCQCILSDWRDIIELQFCRNAVQLVSIQKIIDILHVKKASNCFSMLFNLSLLLIFFLYRRFLNRFIRNTVVGFFFGFQIFFLLLIPLNMTAFVIRFHFFLFTFSWQTVV